MNHSSTLTMFELVSRMNTAFGNPKGDPKKINGSMLMKQVGTHEKGNVHSELKEFTHALGLGDVNGIRDSLCDIMVFVLGAFHRMGIDADRDMTSVVTALYSRFCRDPEHLLLTQTHYAHMGVGYYTEGEFPTKCLKSLHDQYVLNGKVYLLAENEAMPMGAVLEYPKGKFLKAVGYTQPEFYELPRDLTPEEIAARERADHLAREAAIRKKIEEEVAAYRARLEKQYLGLEPYDPNANQCGPGDQERMREVHEGGMMRAASDAHSGYVPGKLVDPNRVPQ